MKLATSTTPSTCVHTPQRPSRRCIFVLGHFSVGGEPARRIALWRHADVVQIVTTVVGVSLVLTLIGLILDWRGGREVSEVEPIEMAE